MTQAEILASKLRFDRICAEEISGCVKSADSIGTYSEKRVHIAFKRFACEDRSCYEVRVLPTKEVKDGESKKSFCIADVKVGNDIYEIQTGPLAPLAEKIRFYLERTDCKVTVIHPLISLKWVAWIDPESGTVSQRRRSPQKEGVMHAAYELYAIREFLGNERLTVVFPLIEAEQYKFLNGRGKSKKLRAKKYETFPLSLTESIVLHSPEDYKKLLLPNELPDCFTASEYAKVTKIKGVSTYSALTVLCAVGFLQKGEKVGRSYIYKRITENVR